MNFLALDPSTRKIGWACLSVGMQTPDFGTLEFPRAGNNFTLFLAPARDWLFEIIEREEITHLIYESPFQGKNAMSLRPIGALNGQIEMACYDNHVDCSETKPQQWRSKVLGVTQAPKQIKGSSKRRQWIKDEAVSWCVRRGYRTETDDEAEALCILAYMQGLHSDSADFDALPLGAKS